MKIDEQKAFNKLNEEKLNLEDEYDKIVAENQKLRADAGFMNDEIHVLNQSVFDYIGLIGSLKNCSWYAALFSLSVSLIFGALIIRNIIPSADWNGTIGIIIGTWWFSLFGYYLFWRAQFWR